MKLQDFTLGTYFVFSLLDSFSGYATESSNVTDHRQLRRKNIQPHYYSEFFLPITTCRSGQLIFKKRLCNGKVDCKDGSDETAFCRTLLCNEDQFRCEYGGCISLKKQCNNVYDCADGSDENETMCKSKLGCSVPYKTNTTTYILEDCDSCTVVKEFTVVEYECVPPYVKSKQQHSVCVQSKWVPDVPVCVIDSKTSSAPTAITTPKTENTTLETTTLGPK